MEDYIDEVIASWAGVRSDVNTESIAVISRILRAAQELQSRLDMLAGTDPRISHKGDLDTLTALRRSGPSETLSPKQLAHVGQLTSGGMTNRLDRLEVAGLITREPHPRDRRSVLVSLTEAGRQLADDAFVATMKKQEAFLAPLSEQEREVVAGALKRLLLSFDDLPVDFVG